MKYKQLWGMILSVALAVTAMPVGSHGSVNAASVSPDVDETVHIYPGDASVFHDTDGDGFGEFEGWGTSLCWWANRLGYSEKMTKQAAEMLFGDSGLDLNIGRYNIGGGDCVGEVSPNENAVIYDIGDTSKQPSYSGSDMNIETGSKLTEALYTESDADFGITWRSKVGNYKYMGWINALGAEPERGGNLTYRVNVQETGDYTVKMLFCLDGSNDRGVSIRINGNADSDRHIPADTVNGDEIASRDNEHMFRVVFEHVTLNMGENTITIGGNNGAYTLNFIKMAVIPSGKEGVLKSDLIHAPHITRSDSEVPGYCTDVTKLTEDMTEADYEGFDRVDAECGYAWNYNWDADKNQLNMLKAAAAASGTEFIAEAFSNSPPYFMTNSGCTSGFYDAGSDNLRTDAYHAFAVYMTDVIVHWAKEGVVDFQSTSPMNEPDTNYWGAFSNKQEGCHFDPGTSQSKMIEVFAAELAKQKEETTDDHVKEVLGKIILAASDETNIDSAVTNYGWLTEEAKRALGRIDTHTYNGSNRWGLRSLAEESGKNLWMSEVDGDFTAGSNAGEMSAALGLGQRIIEDLNGLKSSAWILWDAVGMHADSTSDMRKESDTPDIETLYQNSNFNSGYWGLAIGDHNNEKVIPTKKYYAYGQFTRYIRPGAWMIGSSGSGNTVAAYDPKKQQAVIVAMNTSADDKVVKYDLRNFSKMGTSIQAVRSSGSVASGENWADVSNKLYLKANNAAKNFTTVLKANSITTFVIHDVTYDKNLDMDASMKELPLTGDMISGSEPWGNDANNGVANVVDNNYDTFFDGEIGGYVQIDLGRIYRIGAVGYVPRSGYADRCKRAVFYGSNNGIDWTLLYTISETPEEWNITKKNTDVWETDSNYYRYIKYATDVDNCNVAELRLYGTETNLKDMAADYEQKAAAKNIVENEKKTVFDAAVTAAKAMGDEESEAVKEEAMAAIVTAYNALEFKEEKGAYDYFAGVKGDVLYDTEGKPVQAHGGQVQKISYEYDYDGDGKIAEDEKEYWYWIGEDKTNGYSPCPGIRAYISKDLYNWKDMGNVLKTVPNWETFTTDSYFTELYGKLPVEEQREIYADIWTNENASDGGCVIERPKMLYNEKNQNYVIWFHADGQIPSETSSGNNYTKSKAGVAVSDSPFGPFRLLGSYLLNYNPNADHGFDGETGGHVRDMNLFKDEDKTAYVMYSSDGNETLHIAKLNEDYTNVAQPDNEKAIEGKDFSRNFIGESREAPAMFRYHDKYYMITSGCTGWDPNEASYAVADNPLGPWITMGNPCTDSESDTTYRTQSSCVIPVDAAKGKFIYMGDRWEKSALQDSRYVWLPLEFMPENKIALKRYSNWVLGELEGKGTYQIMTELPAAASSLSDLKSKLPEEIIAKYDDGEEKTLQAVWSGFPAKERTQGEVSLKASLSDGVSLGHTVSLIDKKMIYFFDCDSKASAYVETAKKFLSGKLRNTASDQPYEGNQAGYTGILDTDFGTMNVGYDDVWSHGFYAKEDKNIEYAFDLDAGKYTISCGFQEWWNTERPTRIAVSVNQEELASQTFILENTDKNRQEDVAFTLSEAGTVKVTISKTGSPDPVLSWIAVMKDEESEQYKEAQQRVEEVREFLKAPVIGEDDIIILPTVHENGCHISWTVPENSAIIISSDGQTALVVRGEETSTVTLTAEITDGIITTVTETKTFDITIPAKISGEKPEEPIEDPEIAAVRKELNKVINQAKEKTETDYTPESWEDLQRALKAAEDLPENAEKTTVEQVMQALQRAIACLVEKTQQSLVRITSIKFAEKTYKIAAGRKIDLKKEMKVLPEHVSDPAVTWSLDSKSSKYASLKNGVITMKKAGAGKSVTVTAKANDGSGIQTSIKIKIMKNAVTKISVKKKRLVLKAGKKVTIKPNIKTNGKKANKKLSWTSSNMEYAVVNAKGVVQTKKAGAGKTVTIMARSTDGTNKRVKVKIRIRK